MKNWGLGVAIAGVLLAIGALIMGSTVPQEVPYSVDLPSLTRTENMHNLPKAQLQLLLFMGGCALFLGGIILGAVGQLEETLTRRVDVLPQAGESSSVSEPEDIAAAVIDPETLAAQEAARREWVEDSKKYEKQMMIGAFALIALVGILVIVANVSMRPKGASLNTAAVEITADNLEMLADNLEAQAAETLNEASQ